MDPNLKRQFRVVFDAHDDAIRALRTANTEMGVANLAMGQAIQSHDDAIQAALEANRAALALFEQMSKNDERG